MSAATTLPLVAVMNYLLIESVLSFIWPPERNHLKEKCLCISELKWERSSINLSRPSGRRKEPSKLSSARLECLMLGFISVEINSKITRSALITSLAHKLSLIGSCANSEARDRQFYSRFVNISRCT